MPTPGYNAEPTDTADLGLDNGDMGLSSLPTAVSSPVKPPGVVLSATPKNLENTLVAAADEEAQEALADLRTQRETIKERAPAEAAALKSFQDWMKDNPPPQPFKFQEEAPKYADFAKQVSPWAMFLVALGGKAGKLSGMNMIGAQTGMLKGIQQGDQIAFENAYDAWKTNYQKAKEEHENMSAYYNAMMNYKKNQFGAEQEISQQALTMMGANEKMLTNALSVKKALDKTQAELEKAKVSVDRLKAQTDAKRAKSQDDAIKGAQASSTNFGKLSEAQDDLQKAMKLLPIVSAQFEKETGESAIKLPEKWGSWLTSSVGSPEQRAFVQYMKLAKPLLATLETSGPGQRSNMTIQKMVADSASLDFFSRSPTEISTAITQLLPLVDQQKAQSQQWYQVWSQQAAASGANLPPLAQYVPPPLTVDTNRPVTADQVSSLRSKADAIIGK